MKNLAKRGLSMLLALAMCISLLSGLTFTVGAETVYTVDFVVPTGVDAVASMDNSAGDITLPSAGVPGEEYTFVGWATETVTNSETAPSVYAADTTYAPAADTTLYAVYSYAVGTGETVYKLVTDAAQLVIGSKIVIAASNADYALSTNQKSNNREATAITKSGDTVTVTDSVALLTLGAGNVDGSYSFYCSTKSGYLYAASSSKNYLRTETTLSDNSSFAITVSSDGVASVIAQGTNTRNNLQYNPNNGSPLFSCYSSSQTAVSLYIETADSTTYYTTEIVSCEHTNTTSTTVDATCTEAGATTVVCDDCGVTVSETTIPATGHSYTYAADAYTCDSCGISNAYDPISTVKAGVGDGKTYTFKGIVTYVSGRNVYIEDSTGAICVYFATAPSDIALGDELVVWDTITAYKNLIETTNTAAGEYYVLSSGNTLPNTTLDIATILADYTDGSYDYMGMRVTLTGLTLGAINTSGNTAVTDASGNTTNLYKVSGLAENVTEGDTVDATVIVSCYNGYQLIVNPGTAATDVVVTSEGGEVVIETVTIAEAKAGTAGEYYQVEGTVTLVDGRNVYIQDSTGGIVIYMTANAATTAVGDTVKARGTLTTYNGLIELSGVNETDEAFYSILSSGNTVDAQSVTIADLTADTTNEYLAEKVTLTGVSISSAEYQADYTATNYILTDGTNTIELYDVPTASEADVIAVGSIVSVEAVVSSYNGYQLLVVDASKITVTGTCAHTSTTVSGAKDATCTEAGYTGDTVCDSCGTVVTAGSEIAALGHTDTDSNNYCDVCTAIIDATKIDYSGNYYIAALRSGANYWYMTSDLGTANTSRYTAVDTGLTELPTSISDADASMVFTLAKNEDGTYTIAAYGVEEGYLSWTSGNSGKLVAAADAKALTVTNVGTNTFNINFVVSDTETRYLSLNGNSGSDYFAFYKGTQINDLVLIPVESIYVCEHEFTQTTTVDATCTDDGSTTVVCDDCGETISTTVIPATGHTSVYTDNGDGTHDYTCSVCGTVEVDDATHTYVDGTCVCGATETVITLFDLSGMTMSLGNSLSVNFVVNTANLDGDGHYAVITKAYADGTTKSVTVNQADWAVYSGSLYYFSYNGVAAKEMTDNMNVIVYNADGTQVTNEYNRTIADYCLTALGNEEGKASPEADKLTLYVDMLNYGAAAQTYFTYNTETPANAGLSETQQGYATGDVTATSILVKGTGFAGVTLSLESEIILNFVYQNTTIGNAAYAVATYTDHNGNAKSMTYQAEEFDAYNSSLTMVPVSGMSVADCGQAVTVTLYDADGNVLSTSVDSVNSYISRVANPSELFTMILRFGTAAYNYFH